MLAFVRLAALVPVLRGVQAFFRLVVGRGGFAVLAVLQAVAEEAGVGFLRVRVGLVTVACTSPRDLLAVLAFCAAEKINHSIKCGSNASLDYAEFETCFGWDPVTYRDHRCCSWDPFLDLALISIAKMADSKPLLEYRWCDMLMCKV